MALQRERQAGPSTPITTASNRICRSDRDSAQQLDSSPRSRSARRLVTLGSIAAVTDLHRTVIWEDDTLRVDPTGKATADIDLGGRGLLLIPSAFTWPRVWPRTDPPWDPALAYPPSGIGDLWLADDPHDDALGRLLGRRRAAILRALDRPASTLELARTLEIPPGGVSDHLTVLRRSGPVTGPRDRREVIYSRTTRGDTIRDASW